MARTKNNELFIDQDKLPPCLTKEEQYRLIQLAAAGQEEAKEKLLEHNIRFVIYLVKLKFSNVNYDKKDLVAIGNMGLLRAIDTYDILKGFEFTTYASKCIENEIRKFLKSLKKQPPEDSIDEVIFSEDGSSEIRLEDKLIDEDYFVEDYEQREKQKIIRDLVESIPNDREKEVVMLYFGFYDDRVYSCRKIAEKVGISHSYVANIIKKNVKELGKKLKRAGIIEFHENPKLSTKKSSEEENESKNASQPAVSPIIAQDSEGEKRDVSNESSIVIKIKDESGDITKDDYSKMLQLLEAKAFTPTLTEKESIIIALKLGYVNGKCFKTESISKFLGIEEEEVIETTKKVLSTCKGTEEDYVDNSVGEIMDTPHKSRVLPLN